MDLKRGAFYFSLVCFGSSVSWVRIPLKFGLYVYGNTILEFGMAVDNIFFPFSPSEPPFPSLKTSLQNLNKQRFTPMAVLIQL